jgi:hypothetical protein
MKLLNIIESATEFGTFRSRENFFSYALKFVFYIVPAIVLGNYTDVIMERIQKDNALGEYLITYIIIQTLIIILTLYLILLLSTKYTSEFQVTVAGAYFVVLYFGIQTNYMRMIKEYIN